MKKMKFIIAVFLFNTISLIGQSDDILLRKALNDYIEGTSYNREDQIKRAFYHEADLFLANRDNSLWVVPISEYASWFKKENYGKFTGRIGNILSVDRFQNIATAKVEILFTENDLRYIDLFILRKIEGEWKIISKTASKEEKRKTKILFATSNATVHGTSNISTGNSFAEIVKAYDHLVNKGYEVDFVSPKGGAISVQYIMMSDAMQKDYLYDFDFMDKLKASYNPQEINVEEYSAIYYVGGGAAMYGVPEDEGIQEIARKIYEDNGGVVSAVCHGAAGIVHLKTSDGKYIYEGKKVNGFPDELELKDRPYYKEFPFVIQDMLSTRGGDYQYTKENIPFVIVDGRLVTGQNHLSSQAVAEEIHKLLTELNVN